MNGVERNLTDLSNSLTLDVPSFEAGILRILTRLNDIDSRCILSTNKARVLFLKARANEIMARRLLDLLRGGQSSSQDFVLEGSMINHNGQYTGLYLTSPDAGGGWILNYEGNGVPPPEGRGNTRIGVILPTSGEVRPDAADIVRDATTSNLVTQLSRDYVFNFGSSRFVRRTTAPPLATPQTQPEIGVRVDTNNRIIYNGESTNLGLSVRPAATYITDFANGRVVAEISGGRISPSRGVIVANYAHLQDLINNYNYVGGQFVAGNSGAIAQTAPAVTGTCTIKEINVDNNNRLVSIYGEGQGCINNGVKLNLVEQQIIPNFDGAAETDFTSLVNNYVATINIAQLRPTPYRPYYIVGQCKVVSACVVGIPCERCGDPLDTNRNTFISSGTFSFEQS
jgi:hypothetical protein